MSTDTSGADAAPDFVAGPLTDIASAIDPQEFREFIAAYVEKAAQARTRLLAIAQAHDHGGLQREAHKTISTAGSYGAQRASKIARTIEDLCLAGKPADAERLVPDLAAAWERALDEIRRLFLA